MIDNLEQQQETFINETETARMEYEKEVEELKQAFDNATAEEKKVFEEDITKSFEEFVRVLESMEQQYNDQLAEVMSSLQPKYEGINGGEVFFFGSQRGSPAGLFDL